MAEATHYRWDDLPREELSPEIGRRLITGEKLMIAHVYLKKGAVVPTHSHHNEQITYILEGALRFRLGEDESQHVDVAVGRRLAQQWKHGLGDGERAEEVGLDHAADDADIDGAGRTVGGVVDAGVIDQHVEPLEIGRD